MKNLDNINRETMLFWLQKKLLKIKLPDIKNSIATKKTRTVYMSYMSGCLESEAQEIVNDIKDNLKEIGFIVELTILEDANNKQSEIAYLKKNGDDQAEIKLLFNSEKNLEEKHEIDFSNRRKYGESFIKLLYMLSEKSAHQNILNQYKEALIKKTKHMDDLNIDKLRDVYRKYDSKILYYKIQEDLINYARSKAAKKDPSNTSSRGSIIEAVASNNIELLRNLLNDADQDPSYCDDWAIRIAARNGNIEIVELLLKDPKVNPAALENWAIENAINNGHYKVVDLLLKDSRVQAAIESNVIDQNFIHNHNKTTGMLSSTQMQTKKPIPTKYLCLITRQIMIEPVFAADGYTYEREAIATWLETNDTSPKTNLMLNNKTLTENHDKRADILEYLDEHPEIYASEDLYLPQAWLKSLAAVIKTANLSEVAAWLSKDKRLLRTKIENDYTAWHLACQYGSVVVVELLLNKLPEEQLQEMAKNNPAEFNPTYMNSLLEQTLKQADLKQASLLVSLGADLEQINFATQNTSVLGNEQVMPYPEEEILRQATETKAKLKLEKQLREKAEQETAAAHAARIVAAVSDSSTTKEDNLENVNIKQLKITVRIMIRTIEWSYQMLTYNYGSNLTLKHTLKNMLKNLAHRVHEVEHKIVYLKNKSKFSAHNEFLLQQIWKDWQGCKIYYDTEKSQGIYVSNEDMVRDLFKSVDKGFKIKRELDRTAKIEFLNRISFRDYLMDIRNSTDIVKNGCFISYAWGDAADEWMIHKRIAKDLEIAGIDVIMDINENRSKVLGNASYVIVVGTPALMERWNNYLTAGESRGKEGENYTGNVVAQELEIIFSRRQSRPPNNHGIINLLLRGEHDESFPHALRDLPSSNTNFSQRCDYIPQFINLLNKMSINASTKYFKIAFT